MLFVNAVNDTVTEAKLYISKVKNLDKLDNI